MTTQSLGPIPEHLRAFAWYAPHQAWLRDNDLPHHDPDGATPQRADLIGGDFFGAHLCYANLRGVVGLPEAPAIDKIDAAILAAIEAPGNALDMERWHTCDTTHCRAGWAIHLAGEAGYELGRRFGPSLAGTLIYAASGSHPVPNWFASNKEAMADLRARAAKE